MKIAVPTRNHVIDDHFGHCEYYTIFTISENKEIIGIETEASPEGCGCKSNIASILARSQPYACRQYGRRSKKYIESPSHSSYPRMLRSGRSSR